MKAFVGRLIRFNAVRRGIFGGSRFWTGVFGLGVGWRLVKRFTAPTPEVIATRELRPGDTIVVAHGRVVAEDSAARTP